MICPKCKQGPLSTDYYITDVGPQVDVRCVLCSHREFDVAKIEIPLEVLFSKSICRGCRREVYVGANSKLCLACLIKRRTFKGVPVPCGRS